MNSGQGVFQVICRLLLVAAFSLVQLGSVSLASAADADLDTTYHVDGWSVADMSVFSDTAYGVAVQADGRIVVVGSSPNGSDLDFSVTRRATNGNIDMTMGGDGRVFVDFGYGNDEARDVVVEPGSGDIIVVGTARNGVLNAFAVARLDLLNGAVLGTQVVQFISHSNGYAVALQDDGKIVVAGSTWNGTDTDLAVARLNTDLSLDTSFDGDGMASIDSGADEVARDVVIEPDGRLVLVGSAYRTDRLEFIVHRMSDTGLPAGGGVYRFDADATAYGVALQPDGKIMVVGTCETNFGDVAVMRLQGNLARDFSFSGDGRDVRHFSFGRDEARDVVVQADGRIVVAGWLTRDGSLQEMALLRYTTNGNLDPDFNSYGYVSAGYGGTDTFGRAVDLQPDGKIVVAGYATFSLTNLFVTARFLGDENQIFADGLEYGSTEPWSATVP